MSPWLLAAIAVLIAALVVQVLLPRLGERRIARRLAENGGEAFVALEALPASRLLRQRGDRLMVRGSHLELGMSSEGPGLAVLDGFDVIDIELTDFTTGPFAVSSFRLSRGPGGPYMMRSQARTSGAALADYGGAALGGRGSSLLGSIAKQAPLGSRSFAVTIEVELRSEKGMLTVASGGGSVGGYPAGPIATVIAGAVARRLEIGA